MSATLIDHAALQPRVHRLLDARPPGLTWARSATSLTLAPQDQPSLLSDPEGAVPGRPRPTGHRVLVVAESAVAPPAELPDPRSWSASLALALAEALQGRRPVGQLSRWVDERVLATVTVTVRQRRRGPTGPGSAPESPARLRSVHLQYPHPEAVEASAHVVVADRSTAFAFRLDRWYDRWLCTALELGPRHQGW